MHGAAASQAAAERILVSPPNKYIVNGACFYSSITTPLPDSTQDASLRSNRLVPNNTSLDVDAALCGGISTTRVQSMQEATVVGQAKRNRQ